MKHTKELGCTGQLIWAVCILGIPIPLAMVTGVVLQTLYPNTSIAVVGIIGWLCWWYAIG